MNWNWEPNRWKRSTRILLGMVTVWPPIYIVLFIGVIFSVILLGTSAQDRSSQSCGDLDLIQLDRKIQNGELKQLTVSRMEIVATDRRDCTYKTFVSNESTRKEILREARKVDANGKQRVDRIEENTSQPALSPMFPIGIVALFAAHMITILLIMGLMPLYIILAVKNDRFDQTMRIVWVILICMMGMLAMPVYWYLYIWRKAPPPALRQVRHKPGYMEDTSPL